MTGSGGRPRGGRRPQRTGRPQDQTAKPDNSHSSVHARRIAPSGTPRRQPTAGRARSPGEPLHTSSQRGEPSRTPAAQRQSQSPRPQRAADRVDAGPPPPEDADVTLLAADVRAELRGLTPENAERVGRHLVAAGQLLDEDPQRALEHARAARRTAGRLAVVREAVGLSAYLSGQWQEALTELRAVRRMTGDNAHLPLLADCERGLGRPDRALALARAPEAAGLAATELIELRIVEAGARRDLGQLEAALVVLRDAGLERDDVDESVIRLWYAYAETLVAADHSDQARHWFSAVVEADDDESTDAADRLAELDG